MGRRSGLGHIVRFSAAVALLGACGIEQPVSGPISLTNEWKTIEPAEPLRVAGKNEQKLCMQLVDAPTDVSFEKSAVQINGQWHVLDGEAVDNEQANYGLRLAQLGGSTACLYRAANIPPTGPDFPPDRTLGVLRLRSVPPIEVEKVWWLSYDPH